MYNRSKEGFRYENADSYNLLGFTSFWMFYSKRDTKES